LLQFFERDQGRNLRLAPKLTRVHLHPGAFDKMKVKLAAQLFSNQVASSGMETELSTNLLPASAFPTIDFISNINSLFDILNSTGNIDTDKRNFKNIFKGADYQIQHLQKMLNLFATVKVEDRSGKDATQRMK
jgi:methenyltetrahydromethanopterin cyclohydrolase